MLLAQPFQAEGLADLLVRSGDQDEVAGRPEALSRERGEGDRAGRDLVLHVERAASPHLVADEVARPWVALPLRRIRDDGVRVAEERETRPVPAWEPRDEVRPLGRPRVQLRLDAVLGQVVAEELGGERLVPGRVDGVQPQQLLEQLDSLVPQRDRGHQASCCDSAVSSFRARQSSG
jgi:hypothetical protein